jgi:hypothetical protein
MNIVVNEELKAYIDPLSPDEHEALERSILAEGCRDALVLWGDLLIDGHNRHGICVKHGLPFETVQATHFKDLDDVHLWMIDQHLGRRSVSDFQRGVLALRKREIVAARRVKAVEQQAQQPASDADASENIPADEQQALATREALARVARLSSTQVKQIETIQQKATPEVVAAVKAGDISINAAAAVAQLPAAEQVAAAAAGKDELKLAAKRVREAKRKPRDAETGDADAAPEKTADVAELQQRVETLEQENSMLRQQIKALQDMLQEKI